MPAENQPPAVCPKCGEKFIRASLEGEMYECASVLLPSGNLFQTERCKLIVANQQIATLTESLRVAEEKLAGVEAIAGEWIPRTELLEILHPETKGAKVTTTPPPASDAKPSFHIERIVDGKVSCYTVHHTGIDCFIEDLPTGGMRPHKGWLDPDSVDALHRRLNAALVLNSNQSDELSLQSAEIARLERENATYHADATEAVQLMIEAQKKRDEFRRAANEAKRELAAITANDRAYKAHVAAYNMNGGAATGQVLSSRESFGLSPPSTDHAREAADVPRYNSLVKEISPILATAVAFYGIHPKHLLHPATKIADLCQSAITAATAEKDAEIARLEIDRDNWQASFTRLQAELAALKAKGSQ